MALRVLFCHYAVVNKEGFGRTFMLARELAFKGHNVTLLTVFPAGSRKIFPETEIRDKVRLVIFPDVLPDFLRRTGFGVLSLFLKFFYVSNKPFDVVHADNGHRPSGGWPARLNRRLYRSVYVTEWWDFFGKGGQFDDLSFVKKITKGYYDRLSEVADKRNADFVVTLSEAMKVRAIELGIPNSKLRVINGGSDVRRIEYIAHTRARERFGIPRDAIVFGFIGMNEGEFNDLIPFVEAVRMLKNKLPIVWFTTGRPLSVALKKQYEIGEELIELGWLDYEKYSEAISCADVFLLTQIDNSLNKTRWPNKVGDYLAAGRIILTNPVGDIAHFIRYYPDVFVNCGFSSQSVADEIMRIYSIKNNLIALGQRARELAENAMSWTSKADELESIYIALVKHKNEGIKKP